MKAIIPVAGIGKRLRPHTHSKPKPLISLAGNTILGFILDRLKPLELDEVIFIIGYLGEQIKDYVEKNYSFNARFINQNTFEGLGHAIWLAKDYVDEAPLLIILGDTIIDLDYQEWIGDGKSNILAVHQVEDARRFGVVDLAKDGKTIVRVVEKAEHPPTNLAISGLYYYAHGTELMASLQKIIDTGIKTKDEYQLTDGIADMINNGKPFVASKISGWYDCGDLQSILKSHRDLLSQAPPAKPGEFHGRFPQAIILPPVYIHPTAHVVRSVIGPYVSIGEGTQVSSSVIKETIIGNRNDIINTVLENSIIGDDVALEGRSNSLNIGDYSSIQRSS